MFMVDYSASFYMHTLWTSNDEKTKEKLCHGSTLALHDVQSKLQTEAVSTIADNKGDVSGLGRETYC